MLSNLYFCQSKVVILEMKGCLLIEGFYKHKNEKKKKELVHLRNKILKQLTCHYEWLYVFTRVSDHIVFFSSFFIIKYII